MTKLKLMSVWCAVKGSLREIFTNKPNKNNVKTLVNEYPHSERGARGKNWRDCTCTGPKLFYFFSQLSNCILKLSRTDVTDIITSYVFGHN